MQVRGYQVGSPEWHEYLSRLWGADRIAVLKEAGIYRESSPVPPELVNVESAWVHPLSEDPDAWWADAPPDDFNKVRRLSIYDLRHVWSAPAPRELNVPRVDTVTNARIKKYMAKDVLQVANDTIFPTGDYERHGSTKKRLYDVPPPGKAADPERSLEESKRRAKAKVRDIALCNRFTHMFTWTLDPELIDRYDPKEVYKKVRTFLTNATQRKGFRYVCIPEYHTIKEGEEKPGIHMHGLCILGDVQIVQSYRKDGSPRVDGYGRPIHNMVDWSLGYSTCVPLDDNYERAVNYVTKYITKAETKIFGKWYLSSRSLTKAPDIVPLEPVEFERFRNEKKLEDKHQTESTIFRDVKIVSEEYDKEGNLL